MEYGLIGEKLGHSYSKIIHEKLGAYTYNLKPLAKDELEAFMQARDFKGLNVTIPYKQAVIPFCDEVSGLAREIGAVNTLYFNENGRLCGTNTDYLGFLYAMDEAGISVANKAVVILGDGATHKTIKKAVSDRGAKEIIVASRKADSPQKLDDCTKVNYKDLPDYAYAEIVINSTPVGMYPNTDGCPADLSMFTECQGVFDVIYNPYHTNFIRQAIALDIPFASGLSMLVAQATAAAGFFTGRGNFYEKENKRIISELKSAFTK